MGIGESLRAKRGIIDNLEYCWHFWDEKMVSNEAEMVLCWLPDYCYLLLTFKDQMKLVVQPTSIWASTNKKKEKEGRREKLT